MSRVLQVVEALRTRGITDKHVAVMVEAALKAGRETMKQYGTASRSTKADYSIVTSADYAAEEAIRKTIFKHFPNHGWISEESDSISTTSPFTFVIDPLDGTTNYARMLPIFTNSVGLLKNGEPFIGVVYYPFARTIYVAKKNRGAYMLRFGTELRVSKVKVSKVATMKDSIHVFSHSHAKLSINNMASIFPKLVKRNARHRDYGSTALHLCYIADGSLDSMTLAKPCLWDIAAGLVIAAEAGATITSFNGQPFTEKSKNLLVTNGQLHEEIVTFLTNNFKL